MHLAYGKYDLELNLISAEDWPKCFDSIEIDLIQFYQSKQKVKNQFIKLIKNKQLKVIPRLMIKTDRESSEYDDLFSIWGELFNQHTLYYSVYSGKKKWDSDLILSEIKKLPHHHSYFFEWSREDRKENTHFLTKLPQFGGFVLDPHWHAHHFPISAIPIRFKLHGWNEQRWFRRYGAILSAKILKLILMRKNKIITTSLTLAYSGKFDEAPYFHTK